MEPLYNENRFYDHVCEVILLSLYFNKHTKLRVKLIICHLFYTEVFLNSNTPMIKQISLIAIGAIGIGVLLLAIISSRLVSKFSTHYSFCLRYARLYP